MPVLLQRIEKLLKGHGDITVLLLYRPAQVFSTDRAVRGLVEGEAAAVLIRPERSVRLRDKGRRILRTLLSDALIEWRSSCASADFPSRGIDRQDYSPVPTCELLPPTCLAALTAVYGVKKVNGRQRHLGTDYRTTMSNP